MKKLILHFFPLVLPGLLLSTLAVAHASSPPADGVPFCAPFDSEQWQRDRLRPAAKRLANPNVGEPRTVRLIYFLPKDRTPQQDIDATMDELIKNVQLSYEEMMEYHGFGARTFALETDATGKAVVHHVKGKFNDEYYHTDTFRKVIDEETAEQFDPSANIYLVVLDVSNAVIDVGACGLGGSWGPEGGTALIPAPNSARQRERGWSCFNVAVAAHELGHAFGLAHDHFRNATRSPSSYHTDWMVTSFCAAEWLDAHRYFNRGQTYPQADEPTTIQMLPPLAVPPNAIRLRFEVADPDGLHQAQLHNSTGEAIDCQGLDLDGESASVEFVTPEVTEAPGNQVSLRVVDVYGNVTEQRHTIDITALLPPEVVSIPDANLAAVVREALDLTPGDAISQLDMLKLRRLEATGRQITDLTGLEYAVNLKELLLGDNQISDITPLAKSTIIEGLELYNNNISDISSLAGMVNLTGLTLWDNSVSDLSPLTELINLHGLILGENSVSDLSPLAGLIHLVSLELTNNNISDISSLAAMTHLTFLHLGENSVSDLSPLERLTNLDKLDLYGNSVSDLSPLAELNGLTFLQIEENSVSDLSPLAANTGLGDGDVVYVQENPLSYASINTHIPAFQSRGVTVQFDMRTPTTAQISGDRQVGMPGSVLAEPLGVEVQDENEVGFEGVPVAFAVTAGGGTLSASTDTTDANGQAAITLTLGSDPGMSTVEVTVAGLEPVTIAAIGQAVPPDVADTNLAGAIRTVLGLAPGDAFTQWNMLDLTSLHAEDLQITDLTGLEHATQLRELHLAVNSVSDLSPLAGLTSLGILGLSDNRISDLTPLSGLTNLVELHLVRNSVSDLLPLAELKGLRVLYLWENPISDLSPLAGLTNLKELYLWHNSVSDLSPLAELNGLTDLQLVGNLVSDLSPLVGLTSLTELDLRENLLSYPSINTHIPALQSRGVTVQFDMRTPTTAGISGDGQAGAPGSVLAEPLGVAVRDENGVVYAGVPVTFAITAGGGTLSVETAATDSSGRAATTLTLGSEPGTNTVEVTVAGLEPLTFTATAEATPDFNGDGVTDFSDFFLFAEAFGGSDPRFDLDGSGSVDFADFFLFAESFGQPARAKLVALARELIGLPDGPQLQQNAPNPFNSETVISWFLLQPGSARLEVYALTGQRVAVLQEGPRKAGLHRLRWDGRDDQGRPLASSVYVYRLVTGEGVLTRKLTLLR